MRMCVWSLASLSRLRIQRCHELWCRSQTQLRSGIAMAVPWASSCSSNSMPSLEISMYCRCGAKKTPSHTHKHTYTHTHTKRPNWLVPWSWTSQPFKLWKNKHIFFFYLSCSVYFVIASIARQSIKEEMNMVWESGQSGFITTWPPMILKRPDLWLYLLTPALVFRRDPTLGNVVMLVSLSPVVFW